jgi:hypothetical protein
MRHGVLLAPLLLFGLAGCIIGEGEVEDMVWLRNTTDRSVTVTYEVVVGDGGQPIVSLIAELDPGETGYVAKTPPGDSPCLKGAFVARSGEVVIDEAPGLCRPVLWDIGQP